MRHRVGAGSVAAVALVTLWSSPASAHGLGGRSDLPLPLWMFAYGAAAVLLVSFAALALFWPSSRLQRAGAGGRLLMKPATAGRVIVVGRVIGVLGTAVVIAAAFTGVDLALDNLAPVAVFVVLWVGVQLVAALVGDVWAVVNPFDTLAAGIERLGRGRAPLVAGYALGYWPAAALFVLWAWYELVFVSRAEPRRLGWVMVTYLVAVVVMVVVWGRRHLRQAELFTAWFGLLSAMAPIHRDREGCVRLRPPFAGLAQLEPVRGMAALIVVALGSTSFDGLTRTQFWVRLVSGSPNTSEMFLATLGLLWSILVVAVLYFGSMRVAGRMVGEDPDALAATFAHTLVPIALAYAVAHYFSLLVFEGQGVIAQISDPFARGWNVFGTVGHTVSYTALTTRQVAWVQFCAIVVGHLVAVVWAHDRALAALPGTRATRSQVPLLVTMVVFTIGGLGLLLGG